MQTQILNKVSMGEELYERCQRAIPLIASYPEIDGVWLLEDVSYDCADETVYWQLLIASKEFSPKTGLNTKTSIKRYIQFESALWDIFHREAEEIIILDYYQKDEWQERYLEKARVWELFRKER